MSAPLPAEAGCETWKCSTIGLCFVIITRQKLFKCSLYVTVVGVIPHVTMAPSAGADPGGGRLPYKIYEIKYIHHDFVQIGKQHLLFKAILLSIILSQQCCEILLYFTSLTAVLTRNET